MAILSMADAIQQFVSKSKLKNGLASVQIEDLWKEIMGVTISKYTDKIQLVNETLYVTTSVAALKNELLYQRDVIKKQLNEKLGKVVIKNVVIK